MTKWLIQLILLHYASFDTFSLLWTHLVFLCSLSFSDAFCLKVHLVFFFFVFFTHFVFFDAFVFFWHILASYIYIQIMHIFFLVLRRNPSRYPRMMEMIWCTLSLIQIRRAGCVSRGAGKYLLETDHVEGNVESERRRYLPPLYSDYLG